MINHSDPNIYGLTKEQAYIIRYNFLVLKIEKLYEKVLKLHFDKCVSEEEKEKLRIKIIKSNLRKAKELVAKWHTLFVQQPNWVNEWQYAEAVRIYDKMQSTLYFATNKRISSKSFDLSALKRVPLNTLTEIMPNCFFKNNPFRKESVPSNSLCWNKKTNRWHDFGTGNDGDSIDLVMALNNCSFEKACQYLSTVNY